MDLQGKQYAQVKDRLMQFRTENKNGLIETFPTIEGETILFKARILKDKSDPSSPEATGHAMGTSKGLKAFEKIETIAVGRALALLGYATDGEIASSEEMEEFEEYKKKQRETLILEYTDRIESATTLDELKNVWATIDGECRVELEAVKDARKAKLNEKNTSGAGKRRVVGTTKGEDNGDAA